MSLSLRIGLVFLVFSAIPASGFDRLPLKKTVTIDGVVYRPLEEIRQVGDRHVVVLSKFEAHDAATDRLLWSVTLRDDRDHPENARGGIRLARRWAEGILVECPFDGFYVDPLARTAEPVRVERDEPGECQVHHKPLVEGLASIHYGLAAIRKASHEDEARLFPNALTVINAGCLRWPANRALVRYCPACRDAEKAWKPGSEGVPK
jgi:hypothetical protein